VAAFGFHTIFPLLDMHIAQHYFWIYVLFIFTGGGKYSLDLIVYNPEDRSPTKWSWLVLPIFILLLAFGLYREFNPTEPIAESTPVDLTIEVAGSFNDWDPNQGEMKKIDTSHFQSRLTFNTSGPVEFKFTANKSWDINWGETNQTRSGFPISGIAEQDTSSNTKNIRAYIPKPGIYLFDFNLNTFQYNVDSLKTD
jgi:hypothetical protein